MVMRNKKSVKTRLLIFILLFSTASAADDFTVTIEGSFPGAENKNVRVMKYDDQITYTHKEIDNEVIDEDGLFNLSFVIHEPVYIFYRIDHARMGHFVEPGNTYEIQFDPVDFDTLDDRRNPYIERWHFSFELFNNNEPDRLNSIISEFNNHFDEFLLEHFSNVRRRRLNEPFQQFREYTDSLFVLDTVEDNSFFKNYYEYKFASYYRVANIRSNSSLFKNYIIDKPVKYENTQYMSFFNTMFDKFIFAGSRKIQIYDLRVSVNERNSYDALMDTLGKDTILHNEVLRELVMLKGLKDMYDNPEFSKTNVKSILEQVKNNSKFPEHRKIASNILNSITQLAEGYPVPDLKLKNREEEIICLDDYSGKFLLINFWTTWSDNSIDELSALEDLYEDYSDQFEFLSISVDRNYEDYKNVKNQNQYSWDIYHFNGNFHMLDRYGVRRYPSFILIDPDGNLIKNMTPLPSVGLKSTIEKILSNWNKE